MTRTELIEEYLGMLGAWKDNVEKQRREKGLSADEPMFINATFVTDLLIEIVKDLAESKEEDD